MDDEILTPDTITDDMSNAGTYTYEYPIIDQSNQEITDPDLTLGYLKKEYFTVHHESVPEVWHYKVISFNFSDGEKYIVESENDPHVEVVDLDRGIFNYVQLEGEKPRIVTGQTVTTVVDSPLVEAWDETKIFYRYVLYTEKELADRDFLANGPTLLAEAQETIDDLLLVIADLLGGNEAEDEPQPEEDPRPEEEPQPEA